MIDENPSQEALPVRGRLRLPSGRHRRPESADLPSDAPALVLAVPGETLDIAAEIGALTHAAHTDIDIRVGGLGGEVPGLAATLNELAADRPAYGAGAVVVPLVTGSHPQTYAIIRSVLAQTRVPIVVTDPLGPHPLLAEALHHRLAERGLARADRIRQFSIGSAVDAVIVATVGGDEAVQEAEVTSVLLASRLAVPVVAASIDGAPSVVHIATRLRESGATRLAIAPYLIGPEVDAGRLNAVAEEVGAGCAQPLGAHQGVVRLVNLRYEVALDEIAARWEAE